VTSTLELDSPATTGSPHGTHLGFLRCTCHHYRTLTFKFQHGFQFYTEKITINKEQQMLPQFTSQQEFQPADISLQDKPCKPMPNGHMYTSHLFVSTYFYTSAKK
jgi:hypothetical protein